MLSFVEIHCGQLPLTESLGRTFDCKLMEIFTGELLNDTLVNSPPRALAVRPSLPLSIAVVLLPTTDGCAGLLTYTSRKASVRGPPLALAAVTVVVVLDENPANLFDILRCFSRGLWL